jgi:phosphoesterase RecJ-like protein
MIVPPLENLQDAVTGRPATEALAEVAAAICAADSFVVTAHVNPDGDALGSTAALGLLLRALRKRVRVVLAEKPPEKFAGLFPQDIFEVVSGKEKASALDADFCVLLDAGDPVRAGLFEELYFAPGQRRINVDHHPPASKATYDHQLVVTEAPATGNLILCLIDVLGVSLTEEMAQSLWIAIASDTGWFRFENTSEWALADAARLAGSGITVPTLYARLYDDYTVARARTLGAVLAGLRTELGGDLVWSSLSRETMQAEGVTVGDLDGLVDYLKAVRGAKVVAFIVETGDESFKISLRAPGAGEVLSIARQLGGGGHAKAAGCRFSGSLEKLVAVLGGTVREALEADGGAKKEG